jgi:TonB-linked SusC/RagA family outer membrane protein
MRITVFQCFLAAFALNIALANDGKGQAALDQKVTLDVENQEVKKILSQLEKQTDVKFVFSSKLINSGRKATIKVRDQRLGAVLDNLLTPLRLQYKATDDLIVIKPERGTSATEPSGASKPAPAAAENIAVNLDRTVTGTVTEESGEPLPGVSVVLKGSQTGANTDTKGKFSITVPDGSATLVVSYVGFLGKEVAVSAGQTTVSVSLAPDTKSLDELVVTGYGTQKKESLTGAISVVTSEDLDRVHGGATISSALAGKIPGVTFRMPDGRPGANAAVQIRNMGSPLYVIDGIQQDEAQFNNLSPNDIESLSILKDASAAIYGVRAANGVVVVTTKRGKAGKNTVSLDAYTGWQNWTRFPEVVNDSYQWQLARAEGQINQSGTTSLTPTELARYQQGTEPGYQSFNWKDFIVQPNAPLTSVNLNMSGGSDKIKYYVSGTRLKQFANLGREFTFERSNLQSNVDANITNNLKIGIQISGQIKVQDNPGIPGGDDYWLPRFAILRNRPMERPYANDNPDYLNDIKHNETNWAYNNKKLGGYATDIRRILQSNMYAEWDIPFIKGLKARGMYSYFIEDQKLDGHEYTYVAYTYNPTDETYNVTGGSSNPWRERRNRKTVRNIYQGQLTYNNTFGQHEIGGTFVAERQEERDQNQWVRSVPSTNVLPLIYFANVVAFQDADNQWARIGYVGRATYSYANRYYVEGSFRRDASWKFAPDRRVGFFPSASVGWRISDEQFVKNIIGERSVLDDLKLRASYGVLGDDNVGIGPYDYLPGYNYNQGNAILSGNSIVTSRNKGQIINNITWFKSKILDIGADFSLFGTKVTGSFDYFDRLRTGLRGRKYDVLVPSELGYNLPDENVNSDSQRGWETALVYNNKAGNFGYQIGGNFSFSRSRFESFYKPIFDNSWDQYRNSQVNRYKDIFWGYESVGQFQTQQQIAEYPVNIDGQGNRTLLPGDLIYKDINGDGIINAFDQRPIGYTTQGSPNINIGLNFALTWKQFSFNADFSGGSLYSWNQNSEQRWAFQNDGALNSLFLDSWHRADPFDRNSAWTPGTYPPLRFNDRGHSNYNRNSDFWLHNVKYLRARTLELSYALPKQILDKLKMSRARVYINGFNLFSIDNTKKFNTDPEIANDNGLQYPQNKFVNVGINLSI